MSLRERERPVPSYPFMVEAMKTRYGPRRLRTRGRGMAAASSMMTSSAWPRTCASCGWMYCKAVNQSLFGKENQRSKRTWIVCL